MERDLKQTKIDEKERFRINFFKILYASELEFQNLVDQIMERVENGILTFEDDHCFGYSQYRQRKCSKITVVKEYVDGDDSRNAWIIPFIDSQYQSQCKNPLYFEDKDGEIRLTTMSKGSTLYSKDLYDLHKNGMCIQEGELLCGGNLKAYNVVYSFDEVTDMIM